MRISDWSSDVCSSDLLEHKAVIAGQQMLAIVQHCRRPGAGNKLFAAEPRTPVGDPTGTVLQRPRQRWRSEEHTSELQSLMRISYAVFCLKKKKKQITIYQKYE